MPSWARSPSASSADSSATAEEPVKANSVKPAAEVANGNGVKKDYAAGSKKPEEPEDSCDPGMKTGTKDLYAGKEDKKGRYQWQDTIPADLGVAVENDKTAKCK